MSPEFAEPPARQHAQALPKLVAFEQQAGVGWICPEGPIVRGASLGRPPEDVEIADTQIAPGHRVRRLKPAGLLPAGDGLAVAPAVVEQIAQVERRPGIVRIRRNRRLQDSDLLEPRRKAAGRRSRRGSRIGVARGRTVAQPRVQPTAVVLHQRRRAAVHLRQCVAQDIQRVREASGPDVIERQVESRLRVAIQLAAVQVMSPPVERIEREVACSNAVASASRWRWRSTITLRFRARRLSVLTRSAPSRWASAASQS